MSKIKIEITFIDGKKVVECYNAIQLYEFVEWVNDRRFIKVDGEYVRTDDIKSFKQLKDESEVNGNE